MRYIIAGGVALFVWLVLGPTIFDIVTSIGEQSAQDSSAAELAVFSAISLAILILPVVAVMIWFRGRDQ